KFIGITFIIPRRYIVGRKTPTKCLFRYINTKTSCYIITHIIPSLYFLLVLLLLFLLLFNFNKKRLTKCKSFNFYVVHFYYLYSTLTFKSIKYLSSPFIKYLTSNFAPR